MRFAFICAALEPGRDGVGDYTRRLAGELAQLGNHTSLIALHDTHVFKISVARQEIEGMSVPVLRLPATMMTGDRINEARGWLEYFQPDCVSLQFVPFGFHPKGLCFGMGKTLATINRCARWHIMFHELWLGLGENASLKHRVLGFLQRLIIHDCIGRLRPKVIHTQAEPYREALRRTNIAATLLPLFGNIPRQEAGCWDDFLKPLVTEAAGKNYTRSEVYLAGILGMVHPEWDAAKAVDVLDPLLQRSGKRLVLIFHGKNQMTAGDTQKLRSRLRDRADVVNTGELPAPEISKILLTLDLGLATSPQQNIQKSGSVAAMREHGLPVLVTRDDWRLRGWNAPRNTGMEGLLTPKQLSAQKELPVRDEKMPAASGVRLVAERLLADLS
jgi:hypothetical protein